MSTTAAPPTAATPLLDVRHLRHQYEQGEGAPVVIDDVTFSVGQGEFVAIVGPSGAGKTTLLRCLAGLIHPSGGAVELDGEPVSDIPEGLAVVFQDYSRSLFPWLNVRENVEMPLRRLRLEKSEREERITRSLEEVGLGHTGERYPWQLSGGMQQRVAIARAFAVEPELLLMDEPFASVDAQTRADLQDMILSVWRRHQSTVLFVTHDIDESVYLADRIVVLSRPPARVSTEIEVDLARPRDQITTKELRRFAELRAQTARLIRRPSNDDEATDAGDADNAGNEGA